MQHCKGRYGTRWHRPDQPATWDSIVPVMSACEQTLVSRMSSLKLLIKDFIMKTRLLATIGSALTLATAFCATAHADSTIEARYRSERAVCLSGQSNQDRATCLKEASAARAEARRNGLTMPSAQYSQNALSRCSGLPPSDQSDCQRRIRGEGSVSGSVEAGGELRELKTTVPAPK
jgi:hypothetical protein